MAVFFSGTTQSSKKFRLLALEEQRQSEILKAMQLAKECETNPTLRHEMQVEAQQKLEAQRDFAFQDMQFRELQRVSGLPSPIQQITGHKQFWAWYKQAKLELEQLRETERLNREHLAQDIDTFTLLRRDLPLQTINTDESGASPSPNSSNEIADILPITTPAAFALKHPPPEPRLWFQSKLEKKASISVKPPGKRFSVCEMPQIRCKPEHYNWLQKGLRLSFYSNVTSYDDRRQEEGLRF